MELLKMIIFIIISYYLVRLAYHDWKYRKLPNFDLLKLFTFTLLFAFLSGYSKLNLLMSFGFALFLFIIMLYPYSKRWLGAGDVKMYTLLFATIPLFAYIPFTILMSLSSIGVGLFYRIKKNERLIPFGVVVFIPAILAYGTYFLNR